MGNIVRVLLIDDDTDDRELFEMALDELSVNTEFVYACDGEEALKLVSDPGFMQPHYIFLDLNMPRINGVAFLEELRRRNLYARVPVYIYTTSSGGNDIEKCQRLDGQLFTKHSSYRDLVNDLKERIR